MTDPNKATWEEIVKKDLEISDLKQQLQTVTAERDLACETRDSLATLRNADAVTIADLERQVAAYRQDMKDAAGELRIELPEPGTLISKMLIANVLLKGQLRDAQADATRLRGAIENEPEMPGEMPEEMYRTVMGLDKEGLAEWCRIIVRQTKANMLTQALAGKEE